MTQKIKYDIFKPWLTLDTWQKKYIKTEGNCFLLCGRQSGKTAAMSIKFGNRAVNTPKKIILMLAYTEKQAYALFFKTLMYLTAVHPKALVTKGVKKPTKHIIHLKNGSMIMCYAVGLTGEGIRTYTVTDLVIDEAAPMAREVFTAVTPMLSVTGGTLDISSTPSGRKGYFYDCSDQCPIVKKNFTRFYISAEDCPRHSKDFLESEKESMTELEYAQEYLAMFLDELMQFFSDELIKSAQKIEDKSLISGDHFLGVDVARMGKDETVLLSLCRSYEKDKLTMIDMEITKKKLLTETTALILARDRERDYRKIYIDDGGMGVGIFDPLLENTQTRRKVVAINNSSRAIDKERNRRLLKEDLYFNLKYLMEKNKISLWKNDLLSQSLRSIQFENTEKGIKIYGKYSHITEALIRAAWCIRDKSLRAQIN